MTRVFIDAQTWERLSDPHELLELCDPSGQTLGFYQPAFRVGCVDGGKIRSPYADEEIEERCARPMVNRSPISGKAAARHELHRDLEAGRAR